MQHWIRPVRGLSLSLPLNNFFGFKRKLDIYTDGSHKAKWGSWAFVIVEGGQIIFESSGRAKKTNSYRMEFQAAIEALSYLKAGSKACVYSDSRVLIQIATKIKDAPAANADQIVQLEQLLATRDISWQWVKAHSGIKFNERCDELCTQARS